MLNPGNLIRRLPDVKDVRQNLALSLHRLSSQHPGRFAGAIGQISPPAQQALQGYCSAAAVTIA